jgi:Fe-S-cluster containining protein
MEHLTLSHRIRFRCGPELSCFTSCCRDVNIFLTPYDILRMRNHLGISSEAFLDRFVVMLVSQKSGFPVALLKMQGDVEKTCPFVGASGCTIYADRPWACRMYPLDSADREGEYRYLVDASRCAGIGSGPETRVREYLESQEVEPFESMERPLRKFAADPRLSREKISNPKIQEMCRMALYDLDRFRRFVFESRFLNVFLVEPDEVKRIKEDDVELLKFAYRWLEFGLMAGETMKIREELVHSRQSGGTES